MRNLLSIALCLPLAACVIGDENIGSEGDDPGGSNTGGSNTGGSNDGSITGLIAQDTTWSGTVLIGISGATTRIEPGVTVTVSPGTILRFKPSAGLDIQGTLRIQGTSASKVQLEPLADSSYALILNGAPSAGKLEMAYAVMKGGNIQTSAGSTMTVTDSKMWNAPGDLLIMNGGTVNMSYSQIGPDPGIASATHCNIHTNGSANTISITRSNINGAPYGLMLYGGQNAILTNNNWYDNSSSDVDTQPSVSADVSGSWFDGAQPVAGSGATLTANNLSATKLTTAGVRP
jgi:hypothetical protein